jgi:serine/threonine protein kinase
MGDSTNTSVGTIDNQSDSSKGQKRETLHSRFEFIKILGKGTYGKVKLANDKRTGKQVSL